MPPPTAGDAWLAGRRFGIVIDAGSSGSRLQIYSWKDPRGMKITDGSKLAYTLPKVEKGTRHGDDWVKKVEPGLEHFPNATAPYLTLSINRYIFVCRQPRRCRCISQTSPRTCQNASAPIPPEPNTLIPSCNGRNAAFSAGEASRSAGKHLQVPLITFTLQDRTSF